MTDQPTKGRGGRSGWVWLAAGTALASLVFYAWVGIHKDGFKVEWWGQLAHSVGLFGALFNAGALSAALWGVHLQRVESHEAGESTRLQLKTMGEQLAEFARSAEAQQELATSQARLADAQVKANVEAAELRLAQHGNTIAILDAALAGLKGAEIQALAVKNVRDPITKMLVERRQSIGNRIAWELAAEGRLLEELHRQPPAPREQEDA